MTQTRPVKLEASWLAQLGAEFDQPYMASLRAFLLQEKQSRKVIYPPGPDIFNALNATTFEDVKVVILGQDPYHGPGQAHGLCFSVKPGVPAPPSLVNIFKEIHDDVGEPVPAHGCLTSWARQGVLLLNSVLTVRKAQAGSHQGKGWEAFTDAVIQALNEQRNGLAFMLWGAYAQKKGALISRDRHLCLKAPHPSPLAAHRGFFGCKHFSKANQYLASQGTPMIDWGLPQDPVL